MSALVYHPVFDPYGSFLRSIRYMLLSPDSDQKAQIRIYDFLLLFPEVLNGRNLGRSLGARLRKLELKRKFAYEERPDLRTVFDRMEPSFEAAFQTLVGKGFLEKDGEHSDLWTLNAEKLPTKVLKLAHERNEREASLVEFLRDLDAEFEFGGVGGLKDRTGLMEFRYDVV